MGIYYKCLRIASPKFATHRKQKQVVYKCWSSYQVWASSFRQYGQREKQRWEESEHRSEEETRSERRKSEKKGDAGARKGRKVAVHRVFRWFVALACWERSKLAKDERWKVPHRYGQKHISKSNVENTPRSDHFWKLRCRKSARPCGLEHISPSQKWKRLTGTKHFWMFRFWCFFARQVQGIAHLAKMWAARAFFNSFNYNHHTTLHNTTIQ